jgi:hypothetical protein
VNPGGTADLSKYDAVVVGIRCFNVRAMANLQRQLGLCVNNGGTLVMQYNTDRGIPNDALGPLLAFHGSDLMKTCTVTF